MRAELANAHRGGGAPFRPTRTWWALLVSTALALLAVNLALHLPLSGPLLLARAGGRPILDTRATGYGPAEAHALLTALGEAGRRQYETLLWTLDLAMPALLSAFLWTSVSLGSLRRWRWAAVLGGAADWAENVAVTALLAAFPAEPPAMVRLASALTVSKFALYLAGVALAVGGALARRGTGPSGPSR